MPEERDFRVPRIKPLQVPHRVRELRARVDQAITGKPQRGAAPGLAAGQGSSTGPGAQAVPQDPAPSAESAEDPGAFRAPGADPAPSGPATARPALAGPDASMAAEGRAEASPAEAAEQVPQPAVLVPPVLRCLHGRLEDAGFETIVSPPTAGHVIDLAAERPEGDVQRIVVRAVERLDPDVAKELLKTARELEVDLVLCVADAIQHEALRLLVATKVTVVRPEDTEQVEF